MLDFRVDKGNINLKRLRTTALDERPVTQPTPNGPLFSRWKPPSFTQFNETMSLRVSWNQNKSLTTVTTYVLRATDWLLRVQKNSAVRVKIAHIRASNHTSVSVPFVYTRPDTIRTKYTRKLRTHIHIVLCVGTNVRFMLTRILIQIIVHVYYPYIRLKYTVPYGVAYRKYNNGTYNPLSNSALSFQYI